MSALGLYLLISWHWDKSSTLADALTVGELLAKSSALRSETLDALDELVNAGYVACVTPERLDEEIAEGEAIERERAARRAKQEHERRLNRPVFKLYVIGDDPGSGVVKIGISIEPERRKEQLQAGSSQELKLLWVYDNGSRRLEQWLHRRFAKYQIHREWFDFGRREALPLVKEAVSYWQEEG